MSWENAADSRPPELLAWSRGPTRRFEVESCVHSAFTAQARLTPALPAAVYGDWSMTYAELDERSGRLAAYLQRQGVTTGAMVVCAPNAHSRC
jgi:non-ribosomal peptide synthetase component F